MYLFSPYSVEREYGVPLPTLDITERLVFNQISLRPRLRPVIWKQRISKLNRIWLSLCQTLIPAAFKSIDGHEQPSTNPAGKSPDLLNDAQEYLHLGTDVSCNRLYRNVVNMMTSPDFESIELWHARFDLCLRLGSHHSCTFYRQW